MKLFKFIKVVSEMQLLNHTDEEKKKTASSKKEENYLHKGDRAAESHLYS